MVVESRGAEAESTGPLYDIAADGSCEPEDLDWADMRYELGSVVDPKTFGEIK